MKAILALVLGASAWAIWMWRRIDARRRLSEIESGGRCIGCESRELAEIGGGRVRCGACGHVVALASMQAPISDAEIAALTRPDDPR